MNASEMNSQVDGRTETFWKKLDLLIDGSWGAPTPRPWDAQGEAAQDARSLEGISKSLVSAYVTACLGTGGAPLKEFMDGLEKTILLAGLRLTFGNQKNAAALLGIKPTAMFEKMRKHCINGRRIRLSEKLLSEPPQMMG